MVVLLLKLHGLCSDDVSVFQIVVSLVNNRPSASNFSYSQTLQDWTKATSVRLRLLRTKTLLGHLMAIARADSTVTRRVSCSLDLLGILLLGVFS